MGVSRKFFLGSGTFGFMDRRVPRETSGVRDILVDDWLSGMVVCREVQGLLGGKVRVGSGWSASPSESSGSYERSSL